MSLVRNPSENKALIISTRFLLERAEMKINNPDDYANAINRANWLRGIGATVSNSVELATLEGAIQAYAMHPTKPDESKGKPTPNPYNLAES